MSGLTKEQLELRRNGIGASEIAAICGLNPWRSAHDVWLLKRGLADEVTNVTSRMGLRVEAAVRAEYCEDQGVTVEDVGTIVHPTHSWMMATPDGKVVGVKRLLEIKCVSWRMAHHWGTEVDAIPDYYRPQVEQQLEVCDEPECHVAAWIGGADFRIYTIKRDPSLASMLIDIGARFWRDYVLTGNPPPVDGSDGARRMLDKMFPRHERPMLEATPDIDALAAQLREAKAAKLVAEEAEATAQNRIVEAIGAAEGVAAKDYRITYRADKAGKRRFLFKPKEGAVA